jgi:8-hydroxy-5-deazaflavin:NADPH oxidoreductase
MNISIIGGTGKLGFGLAKRFASINHSVVIGSREKEKAVSKAMEINEEFKSFQVKGEDISTAAECGDIVFITVPYAAQKDTIDKIKGHVKGKVVIDATVPLQPGNPTNQIDSITSSAEDVLEILGNDVKLVSGFHTISHTVLNNVNSVIESDVLICSNDTEAIEIVSRLIEELGANPVNAGNLKNARVLERLTPMIIGMNKHYKKRHIGIKITGLEVN